MLHTEDIYQIFSLCVWFCCMEFMLDLSHPNLQLYYLNLICLLLPIPCNNLPGSITHSGLFPGPLAFRCYISGVSCESLLLSLPFHCHYNHCHQATYPELLYMLDWHISQRSLILCS